MDHDIIDQFDYVDRYLMGRLTAGEISRFEEHFVDCSQCIERLRTTESFLAGLRSAAVRRASPEEGRAPKGPYPLLIRVLSARRTALASVCVIVVASAAAVYQIRRLRLDVDQEKQAAAQQEQRFDRERRSADESREAKEKELVSQIRQLEVVIQSLGQHEGQAPGPPAEPLINVSAVNLTSLRGGESDSISAFKIRGPSINWFFISIRLEDEDDSKDYCVTITDSHDRQKWKHCGFKRTGQDYLSMLATSLFLRPGEYHFIVEGVTNEGGRRVIGAYPLVVSR